MVNKILGISSRTITESIHPDGERNKRTPDNQKNDHHNNSSDLKNNHEDSELEKNQSNESLLILSRDDLNIWIKELNEFDCYHSIGLKFIMEDDKDNKIIIHLKDKKGHNLQEYLPLQIKALNSQIKKDLAEIPKGTILNISC